MESISSNSSKEGGANYWPWIALGLLALFLFSQLFEIDIKPRFWPLLKSQEKNSPPKTISDTSQKASAVETENNTDIEESVLPSQGVALPIKWGNFGQQMIEQGVIDKDKLESLYAQRGGLNEEEKKLLYGDGEDNKDLKINAKNSGFLLNLLWAFGLANKNPVLEQGPMTDSRYGGEASRFASTGGWTLAKGDVMEHYSRHSFIVLTDEQQALVERVSKNIYRPCCGNSTYFPDCNHGMAMLGLLELMAAEGLSEEEMYKVALAVNSYWFPDTYLTIAKYFNNRGIDWDRVNPKEILGSVYSGASGYSQILKEVEPVESSGGGGCGV